MFRIKHKFSQFFWPCALVILVTLTTYGWDVNAAYALLRQHHDSPSVLRYHSQVSIKDEQGYAWQVLLFKQNYQNVAKELRLRLVGFPGVAELVHPKSLEIITAEGKILSASDVYARAAPANNVGEYDVTDVLPKLSATGALKLYVPVSFDQPLLLKIPDSVVTEWQLLITDID
ncbi:MAG: DUF3122 domain-containing protein [Goleter apudmare HA4340-LM2]|jgi:hypothetical protein|nr:DUF3122 domain-containing protein [Goleter apudmare HA4340-LM2]